MHKPTERVLAIMLLLAQHKDGLNLTDISEKTTFPKSTISPILTTLAEMKFIYKNDSGNYKIGINSFIVGESFVESTTVLGLIKSYMREIVDQCNEICQLGILNGTKVLYVAKTDPNQPIKLVSSVGKMLPAHATSLGKSLLSKYSPEEIKLLFKEGLSSMTENTITDIDTLIEEIRLVKERNYSMESEESAVGIECVAIPIIHHGTVVASISISIPKYRITETKLEKVIQVLLRSKEQIEEKIAPLEIKLEDFF